MSRGSRLTWSTRREQHVGDLSNAMVAPLTYPHCDAGVGLVLKVFPAGHNGGPCLADDARAGWNGDGVSDDVRPRIEEDDLIACVLHNRKRRQ